MANNEKDNDEYQFLDLESAASDSVADVTPPDEGRIASGYAFAGKKNVKRNALMVVLFVIILMIIYSVMNVSSSNKKKATTILPAPVSAMKQASAVPVVERQPVVPSQPLLSDTDHAMARMNQKLSELELNQEGMRVELTSSKNQMAAMSNSLNEMIIKISELNQTMVGLAANMDAQSREMKQLFVPKIVSMKKPGHQTAPRSSNQAPALKYYIQAVIPGRAWLIATNGTTLTVREGTQIAGYGSVKLIDSAQGRIITGSGQVIRFSQEDS